MAKLKGQGRPGAPSPAPDGVVVGQVNAGINDAQREVGSGQAGPGKEAVRKAWIQVKELLSALETNANPVCAVYWPEAVGALWTGVYGAAKIHEGEPLAVTSDGARHAL